MITSLGAEAVERAQAIARQADIIAALTLEVLKGTTKAFDSGEQLQTWWTKSGNQFEKFTSNFTILYLSHPSSFSGLLLQTSTRSVPTQDRSRWPNASARCWTLTTIHPRLQVRGQIQILEETRSFILYIIIMHSSCYTLNIWAAQLKEPLFKPIFRLQCNNVVFAHLKQWGIFLSISIIFLLLHLFQVLVLDLQHCTVAAHSP